MTRRPCGTPPIKGLFDDVKTLEKYVAELQAQGAIDLSGYATVEYVDNGLDTKADTPPINDDRYYTETEIDGLLATKSDNGHEHSATVGSVLEIVTVQATGTSYMNFSGTSYTAIPNFTASVNIGSLSQRLHITAVVCPYFNVSNMSCLARIGVSGSYSTPYRWYTAVSTGMVIPMTLHWVYYPQTTGWKSVTVQLAHTQPGRNLLLADTSDRYPYMSVLKIQQ